MKLTNIIWAILTLVILIGLPAIFYRTNSKLGGGVELFAYFLLLWTITTILSPTFLILKRIKFIKKDLNFLFTTLSLSNLLYGGLITGTYLSGQLTHPGPIALPVAIVNLILAILIVIQLTAPPSDPDEHKPQDYYQNEQK